MQGSNRMIRREFLKHLGVSLAVPSLVYCGGKNPGSSSGIKTTHPYYDPKIEVAEASTSSEGIAKLDTGKEMLEVIVEDAEKKPLENVKVDLVSNPEETILLARDFNREYFPGVLFSSNGSAKPLIFDDVIKLFKKAADKVDDMVDWVEDKAVRYLPKEITEIPSHYKREHVLKNLPFVAYQGDWSFDDLKNTLGVTDLIFNITGGKDSSILSFLGEGADLASLVIDGVSSPGGVMRILDKGIDLANKIAKRELIDRDKVYSWYSVPGLSLEFVLPSIEKENKFDIKYYYPTQPGNEWTYGSGWWDMTMRSLGVRKINGKELILFQDEEGGEEYYGFDDDRLALYGFHDYGDDFFFNKPIVIGGDDIRIGKEYSTKTGIKNEEYSDMDFSLFISMLYEKREDAKVPAGYFGDCLKLKEMGVINLRDTNTGETGIDSGTVYHWFARNVGHVKIEAIDDGEVVDSYELGSANVNGISMPKSVYSGMSRGMLFPRLVKKNLAKLIKT